VHNEAVDAGFLPKKEVQTPLTLEQKEEEEIKF
jgi:hypothetical protein